MAMTTCRECDHDVSELALACPHCGSPRGTGAGAISHGSKELLKLLVAMVVLGSILLMID